MNLRTTITSYNTRSRSAGRLLLIAFASVAILAAACVQESGTYPIETFTEMHYSQAYRSQEIPRLPGVESAVAYNGEGNAQDVLEVLPANEAHPYDAEAGAELYRVNCSVCHGVSGLGDGSAVAHIISANSAWASDHNGVAYNAPPDLQELRDSRGETGMFSIVDTGGILMPKFGPLLSEAERWDIIRYIFDESGTGLGQ
ncbi:MAG: cytochrome c [Dehalococcoidia bacterium]|nr:cytochrome c [Dehalococcoidia bacterium]